MMSAPSISALTAGISFSACTQARTKKPMKPSFVPCFFSNRSRYCERSAMTWPMSTSLKVVSMAAVFCASLSRRAMVWRSRVIFTRSSRAASSAGDGARTCTAAAGCATGVGCAAARSIAASMSPLVTLPSFPVPDTAAASMPVSAAILRTDGASGLSAAGAAAGAGFGGAGGGADCAAGCGAAFAGAAPAPSLIWPSTAPTATVSPSLAAISLSTPAAGAGTSIVTLSVSSSTSGSSTATASPGFLNHLPMVASVTDSPSVGTRISAIFNSLFAGPLVHRRQTTDDRGRKEKIFICYLSSVLRRPLSQRVFQKLLELRLMQRHLPDRGRGRRRPPGVTRAAMFGADLVEHPFEEDIDEHPAAHVARLFLAPHDLGLLEARQLQHQRLGGERIELLDAQQIDVVDAALLALLVEIVIDLAGTDDDAAHVVVGGELDLLVRQHLGVVPQQPVERGVRPHLIEPRHRALVAQQRLGRHQDQRLAEVAIELAAQDVKVVRRRRAVGDLHVVLGAHLQEALEPRRGMLRPLPFIAVRQEAHEPRHAQPFAFARRDELVEHHLGAVGEIAELRLPQSERIGLGERIAVLEAEHGFFREHGIDHLVAPLAVAEMIERRVAVLVLLVDQHRMALRERAAFGILAGQPHPVTLLQQRAEGECFAGRPVDIAAGLDRLAAAVEEAIERAMQMKALRPRRDLVADLLEFSDLDAGMAAARIVGLARPLESGPAAVEPIGLVGAVALRGFELDVEAGAPVRLHLLDFAGGDDAFADQLVAVDLQGRGMRGDRLVHQRLGELRLVALVVAVAAIAEHVDHNGLLELLPELGRDLGSEDDGFRIVAIDVENRRLDHFSDVGRVRRRARITRIGGEADLVVEDEMHRSAGAVAAQAGETQAFRHHTLPGERRIAVDQERHHHGAIFRCGSELILLGAHLAEHDGIDDFQMRRIGGERQMHLVGVELAIRRGAELIFNV